MHDVLPVDSSASYGETFNKNLESFMEQGSMVVGSTVTCQD